MGIFVYALIGAIVGAIIWWVLHLKTLKDKRAEKSHESSKNKYTE